MEVIFSKFIFWHWFALAVILAILDVSLGANFLFVWCGLSAALVGILLLIIPNMMWQFQFLIFGLGVMASLVVWAKYLKKYPRISDNPNLNRRAEQYIGQTVSLYTPIINGRGKIKVGDSVWIVTGEDLPQGTNVRVVDVDGVVLKVEKV